VGTTHPRVSSPKLLIFVCVELGMEAILKVDGRILFGCVPVDYARGLNEAEIKN
jgi:hypothetical protein